MVSVASDDELLTSGDAEAFGVFYDRHVRDVLAYMMRRTGDPEVAADLTAETFAAAIVARRKYRPGRCRRSAGFSRSRSGDWSTTSGAATPSSACGGGWGWSAACRARTTWR